MLSFTRGCPRLHSRGLYWIPHLGLNFKKSFLTNAYWLRHNGQYRDEPVTDSLDSDSVINTYWYLIDRSISHRNGNVAVSFFFYTHTHNYVFDCTNTKRKKKRYYSYRNKRGERTYIVLRRILSLYFHKHHFFLYFFHWRCYSHSWQHFTRLRQKYQVIVVVGKTVTLKRAFHYAAIYRHRIKMHKIYVTSRN